MRKANIDKLTQMLSSEQHAKAYEVVIVEAPCSFSLPTIMVSSMEEFIGTCARFCAHCAKQVMPTADPKPEWAWNAAIRILSDSYPGGLAAAYADAKEGDNGGMHGVLDAISDALLEQRAEEYFQYALHECVDTMDPDDVLALTTQLLDKFGGLLYPRGGTPSPASLIPVYVQTIRTLVQTYARFTYSLGSLFGPTRKEALSHDLRVPTAGDVT